jgi:hypothetical protein
MSKPALAKITPVKPPTVNKKINPLIHRRTGDSLSIDNGLPYIDAIHENTFIPVGTAIIMVAPVKYARVSTSNPTVYI